MHSELKDITPELAAHWLENHNQHNRKLRRTKWEKIAVDMSRGDFQPTHQGIAFAYDGTLLDGQHRLKAIVESGVTARLFVVYGMDYGAQKAVDDHAPRSYADALSLAGHGGGELDNREIAIARCMARHAETGQNGIISKAELATFVDQHIDTIRKVRGWFTKSDIKGLITAPIIAATAVAAYSASTDRLAQFGDIYSHGMAEGEGDRAAISLRNYVINNPGMARRTRSRKGLYLRTHTALKAFAESRSLKIVQEAKTPIFRLPEEGEG